MIKTTILRRMTHIPVLFALALTGLVLVALAWLNEPLVDRFMITMVPKS